MPPSTHALRTQALGDGLHSVAARVGIRPTAYHASATSEVIVEQALMVRSGELASFVCRHTPRPRVRRCINLLQVCVVTGGHRAAVVRDCLQIVPQREGDTNERHIFNTPPHTLPLQAARSELKDQAESILRATTKGLKEVRAERDAALESVQREAYDRWTELVYEAENRWLCMQDDLEEAEVQCDSRAQAWLWGAGECCPKLGCVCALSCGLGGTRIFHLGRSLRV